ncbi:MAG: thymidine phosphorylase [Chloroflexota bacterium]|jgi:pyrimidine-nucleoside phosphorylase
MRMVDLIETKRDGGALSREEIEWFVQAYTAGNVPDYQAAALLMAIYFQGMDRRETIELTMAMARSGEQLDLHDTVPFVVDKHSSGGVGDKTTMVVQPLVAASGVPFGKMSGRGLGSSGGTIDKMESIAGWSADLSLAQFKQQLADIGLVLAGQTAELAPADGKLYALRDVTGTVANVSLIAASIMSKKLAAGADAIVLDVKVGKGAFMPDLASARELARLMVDIGQDAGRKTVALIADMNQPLGHAVGNALEVSEALATLNGDGPPDLWVHCLELSAHLLVLADKCDTLEQGKQMVAAVRDDGRALAKFRSMVSAQGGDVRMVDDPDRLPRAAYVEEVMASKSGYIAGINAGAIGWDCVKLGGGRLVKSGTIDPAVGEIITIKVGDQVNAGDLLGTVHANDEASLVMAKEALRQSITWSHDPVDPLPHFYETVT